MEPEGGGGGGDGSVCTGRTWAVGRVEPARQLAFGMKRQDRSFSGSVPDESGHDTHETQTQLGV